MPMSELTWIELVTVTSRLDRFVQMCMIMAHRDFNDLEKAEFKAIYLKIKDCDIE